MNDSIIVKDSFRNKTHTFKCVRKLEFATADPLMALLHNKHKALMAFSFLSSILKYLLENIDQVMHSLLFTSLIVCIIYIFSLRALIAPLTLIVSNTKVNLILQSSNIYTEEVITFSN